MEFSVKKFISTEDKFNLIDLSLKEATINGAFNSAALEILFKVNLFLDYTDSYIPEEFGYNKVLYYDELVKQNAFEKLYAEIDGNDLNELNHYLELWTTDYKYHLYSMRGVVELIKSIIEEMVNGTSNNLNNLKDLNLEDLKQLIPLAKDLGFEFDQIKESESV